MNSGNPIAATRARPRGQLQQNLQTFDPNTESGADQGSERKPESDQILTFSQPSIGSQEQNAD